MRFPLVQTGMGWVAGPRLVAATCEAGGLGILASATMTLEQLAAAIAEVRSRTQAPFGVNLRTDVADVGERIELMIETGARVASFAQAPNAALVARCKEAGPLRDAHRGGPAPCREGGRMGRGRGHRPGGRRRRPHRHRPRPRCCCPKSSTRWATGCWCSAPADSSAVGAWWPPWPTEPLAWPWAPASSSRPRAGCPTRSRTSIWAPPSPGPW